MMRNAVAEGQCAVVAALVLALDEACVLPRERYAHFLHDLWLAMPEERAVGVAGAMVDRVLDLVAMGSRIDDPADEHGPGEDCVAVYGERVVARAAA